MKRQICVWTFLCNFLHQRTATVLHSTFLISHEAPPFKNQLQNGWITSFDRLLPGKWDTKKSFSECASQTENTKNFLALCLVSPTKTPNLGEQNCETLKLFLILLKPRFTTKDSNSWGEILQGRMLRKLCPTRVGGSRAVSKCATPPSV